MFYKKFAILCAMLAVLALPGGCDFVRNAQKPDRDAGYEIQDYRDALAPRPIPDADEAAAAGQVAGAPELQPYIVGGAGAGAYEAMPIVTLDVQGQYALRTLFYELAREGGFDLELDPRITGSIYFRAQERPLDEVLRRVADMAGLRYTFADNVLRVELDSPYNKVYKLDYLSYIRSAQSGINTDISVVSTEGGTEGGSTFTASSETTSDFWAELDAGLAQILSTPAAQVLRTGADPQMSSTIQTVRADPIGGDGPPDVILDVGSLPVGGGGASSDPFAASQGGGGSQLYSINKQAGIVNVYATERQHKEVAEYLREVRRSSTAQVLIEAKVLEVALVDQYQTGIDWELLGSSVSGAFGTGTNMVFPDKFPVPTSDNMSQSFLRYTSGDFNAFIDALSIFGTVRGLASPRITVINNQPASLNVSENIVYFEIDIEQNEGDDNNQASTTFDSEIKTVPEGVIINVLPSIDLDDRTISLALRPSITSVTDFKTDPAAAFVASIAGNPDITSEIPEMSVQEIDSVIRMRSGQAIVMGGLLEDKVVGEIEGIPGLNELPIGGALFRKNRNYVQKTELVIFLKATILDNPADSITDTDRDLYKAFARDRRPWAL
jgi:MSHA biogenesis protein MshL